MLKTRHWTERNVFSDHSDIVALHAKLLQCRDTTLKRAAMITFDVTALTHHEHHAARGSGSATSFCVRHFLRAQAHFEATLPARRTTIGYRAHCAGMPVQDVVIASDQGMYPCCTSGSNSTRWLRAGSPKSCPSFGAIRIEKLWHICQTYDVHVR